MSTEKVISPANVKIESYVSYLPKDSQPEQSLFVFAYKIRIQNLGSEAIKLLSRHWIITNALDEVEEVKGLGVVGLQPKIEPGSTFEYESLCPLTTSTGSMKGFYHFVREDGSRMTQEIPEFFLVAPQALH
jgi:ApaG protein